MNFSKKLTQATEVFKNIKLTLGKGIVKFQNLHWGVVENTYQDGGTVLQTENGWRKLASKAFFSIAYGNRSLGHTNTFSIWGDSQEVQYDENGNPKFVTSGTDTKKYITAYTTDSVPAFTTKKQLGLANKFEFYKDGIWTFTTGQAYYKSKLQDKASYALDFGATLDSTTWEYWLDAIYGFTSKAPFDPYTTFRKNEYFIQTGLLYHIDELWSLATNMEYLHVKDQAHRYTSFVIKTVTYNVDSSKFDKDGTTVSENFKIELGGQYKLSKSSFITSGVLYERKTATLDGVKGLNDIKGLYNPNTEAYKFLTSVSFWF